MQTKEMCKRIASRALVALLAVALVFTMMPLNRGYQAHAADALTTQTPALVVTGQGQIGNSGKYSADNVSMEKSYSVEDLKSLGNDSVVTAMYSGRKSKDPYTKSYTMATGVTISSLVNDLGSITDTISIAASDGYATTFVKGAAYTNDGKTKNKPGLDGGRYYYDGFQSENAQEVPAMIAWAASTTEGINGQPPETAPQSAEEQSYLRLYVGQYDSPDDMNQPLFNGKEGVSVNSIKVGDAINEVVLKVNGESYTRADILMMDFAERKYKYQTNGEFEDTVRGVPFSVLLKGEDENAEVSFEAADGYDMSSSTKTVKELVEKNYMLAYEVNGKGVYSTAKKTAPKPDGYGMLTMYGDGDKPAKMINNVTVGGSDIDFSTSPYKHVTNGGFEGQDGPYNIDSITGATLTIEGPGMKTSTPLSVKDLESKNAGCARGVYTDTRDGNKVSRTFEGVDLYYILTGLSKSNIEMTDKAYKVTIKNRNRRSIATLTLDQIKEMHESENPALVAYGTAMEDGTNPRPFVFDGATAADRNLGNEDGCLKFVYDLDKYGNQDGKYKKFGNMAYIYVEEEGTPGFKHTKAPYNTAENSQYVLTVTGDELGKEVIYTVDQLENLVEYDADGNVVDNGYGYRDEYSLANSSYWYVNTYEGVKLWSLLQHSGIPASKATDKDTLVSFSATDGYTVFDKFSLKQCADPNEFGFYEKNALDNNDGTYVPNENIRQGDDVTTGDKIKEGYPVLVSYGSNQYPYVISKDLDGYLSGLSNDGGPLRVISGKWNYNHANGSNQAKLLDKIIVGDNNYNYSTHSYQPADSAYKALEDSKITVKINDGSKDNAKDYSVKDIEELIYGGKLTKTQLGEAKVKNFYETKKNGSFYSDLYEGINLNYFLTDVVELTGSQGSITFKNGTDELTMSLEDVLSVKNGYNGTTKLSGLTPVLAYAKNGYPLVAEKSADGWVKTENLINIKTGEVDKDASYTVQNHGGPLQLVFPRKDKDADDTLGSMTNITSIEINLEADAYAHIGEEYQDYADSTLNISGEGTRVDGEKTFTVSDLEGKQSLATTKDYSFRNSSGSVSQQRYRGLNLYNFLKSTNVGLKNNADKILIYADGVEEPYEFTLSDIRTDYKNTETGDSDLPVMLAYGSAAAGAADIKDGKPLVGSKTDAGYVAAYGNDGGPLKLIIGQIDENDTNKSKCVKNVNKIVVTASEQTSWNHNSAEVFKQYLNDTLKLKVVDADNNVIKEKTYKVSEIEEMTDIISQEEIYATSQNVWEGVNFWQLIQRAFSDVEGINDPITITCTAKDGFSADMVEKVGLDGLRNGVKDGENYVPVLLAYAVDGYPLVYGGKGAGSQTGEGYDSTADNKGGPLRLMVHMAQGACLMETIEVTIKVGEAKPVETPDFKVSGVENGDLTVADLKKLDPTEKEYTVKGETEKARGVLLKDLLESLGVTDKDATFRIDAGGYAGDGTYNDISLKDAIDQDYLVAYEEFADGEWKAINDTSKTPNSKVRIYRNYMEAHPEADQSKWYNKCQFLSGITVSVPQKTVFDVYEGTSQPGDLPMAGIRSTAMDKDGNLWVGTYGGGASYKAKGSDKFVTYNKASEPALNSATVSAVCPDGNGGVWMTQNSSYTDGTLNSGVAYMKDGAVKYYRASDDPATIPNDYVQEIKIDKNGNVWFGSFGGLTKYDPKAGTWQTWDAKDGFPAMSIDNIEFDSKGGIWCGFYPESEATDGSKPFKGGFAYFKDGSIKSYGYESKADDNTGAYRLGDVWVRDIAVDKNGAAWVVASGSYGGMKNTGGKVWYVSEPGAVPQEYTGFDLFGEDNFSTDSELRMVTVAPDGGLWFGTSKDGVFRVDDPTVVGGTLTLTDKYSSATGSWHEGYDNIYSLDFYGNTLYAGSSTGLATHEFEFVIPEPPATDEFGDAVDSKDTADLTITGDALAKSGYFTIKGIKNWDGVNKVDATFHTLNSTGTEEDITVQGVTLENLIELAGMDQGAELDYVEIVSADGKTTIYTAEQALNEDLQGNKAMFIWKEGETKPQKVVRGQFSETDTNKGSWAKDAKKIIFHKKTVAEPFGDATADTADLTITGDALARDGYFTIKGIKNWDGVVKVDATFHTLNSTGTEEDIAVQGVTLENIIELAGLAEGAVLDSVDIISADGRTTTYTAEQALSNDLQGNKAMFIWKEGETKPQKVVRGQFSATDKNKGAWAKDANKIIFNKKTESSEAGKVIEAIDALPAADKITVDNADAIIAARAAYDALTDGEKALVTNLDKLEAAEAALDEIVKEEYIEKGEELIDDIDYSEYSATRAVALWLNINRLESKLNAADSAAEAAEICNKIKEAIANTPTEADEVRAALNDYPVEVKAKAGKTTIGLTWNTIPKAEAYDVYRSTSPADGFAMIKTVTDPAYTDAKATIERTYFYKVVPKAKVNEDFVFGEESPVCSGKIKLAKPVIKSVTRSKTALTIKWGKVTGAIGYKIYVSTKKTSGFKAYKTVKGGSTVSYVKKPKSSRYTGKTYYFKMRAYKVIDGKRVYSSASTVKVMKKVR